MSKPPRGTEPRVTACSKEDDQAAIVQPCYVTSSERQQASAQPPLQQNFLWEPWARPSELCPLNFGLSSRWSERELVSSNDPAVSAGVGTAQKPKTQKDAAQDVSNITKNPKICYTRCTQSTIFVHNGCLHDYQWRIQHQLWLVSYLKFCKCHKYDSRTCTRFLPVNATHRLRLAGTQRCGREKQTTK